MSCRLILLDLALLLLVIPAASAFAENQDAGESQEQQPQQPADERGEEENHPDGKDNLMTEKPGESYRDPHGIEWVTIVPMGATAQFEMGCVKDDPACQHYEQPLHSVTLKPYRIMKTEVVVGMYRKCVVEGVCSASWRCQTLI